MLQIRQCVYYYLKQERYWKRALVRKSGIIKLSWFFILLFFPNAIGFGQSFSIDLNNYDYRLIGVKGDWNAVRILSLEKGANKVLDTFFLKDVNPYLRDDMDKFFHNPIRYGYKVPPERAEEMNALFKSHKFKHESRDDLVPPDVNFLEPRFSVLTKNNFLLVIFEMHGHNVTIRWDEIRSSEATGGRTTIWIFNQERTLVNTIDDIKYRTFTSTITEDGKYIGIGYGDGIGVDRIFYIPQSVLILEVETQKVIYDQEYFGGFKPFGEMLLCYKTGGCGPEFEGLGNHVLEVFDFEKSKIYRRCMYDIKAPKHADSKIPNKEGIWISNCNGEKKVGFLRFDEDFEVTGF